jgi:hypothetical protein
LVSITLIGMTAARKKHSDPHAQHASRRQVHDARQQLAAGGLSHQERRRLRSEIRERDTAARRRRGEFRHVTIVVAGALAAMAVVAAMVGLVSAIEAATGHGVTGTFVAGNQSCVRRAGCAWWGTFQSPDGNTVAHVVYRGDLPADAGPGMSFPAVQAGSDYVYPPHGGHAWITDVLWMVLIGGVVGLFLWITPLGLGRSDAAAGAVV